MFSLDTAMKLCFSLCIGESVNFHGCYIAHSGRFWYQFPSSGAHATSCHHTAGCFWFFLKRKSVPDCGWELGEGVFDLYCNKTPAPLKNDKKSGEMLPQRKYKELSCEEASLPARKLMNMVPARKKEEKCLHLERPIGYMFLSVSEPSLSVRWVVTISQRSDLLACCFHFIDVSLYELPLDEAN